MSGHSGEFARIEGDQTHKVDSLIEEGRANELFDRWLHEQLQVGFDEADRGPLAEWDRDIPHRRAPTTRRAIRPG